MSNAGSTGTPAPTGFWRSLRRGLLRELSYFKRITAVGLVSTVAYFQNLSAYEDKVATQAKDDLTAATQAFAETSAALSVPLSLQERLVFAYYDAVKQKIDNDDTAYVTKRARAIDGPYEDAYTALRQNINFLAQKVELYLDWPSNASRDPAVNIPPTADPINSSVFGTFNFDCDVNMPAFDPGNRSVTLADPKGGNSKLVVDWYSAKHNILTIYYCFNVRHEVMKPLREWASVSAAHTGERAKFIDQETSVKSRLTKQVLRLYAFMGSFYE